MICHIIADCVNSVQGRQIMHSFILSALISASALASTNIIYGDDGRVEIHAVESQAVQNLGQSIAARVSHWSLDVNESKFSFSDVSLLSDMWAAGVCADEKFAKQPTVADCTGFLVGEDLLVTAGHCALDVEGVINNEETFECQSNSWVFDYKMQNGSTITKDIKLDSLYNCKEVIFGKLTEDEDFALIRLDRKVIDRNPLKMRSRDKIRLNEDIFVIGHPSGLPMKYTGDSQVRENSNQYFFSTNLDTFGGNSGSPVFNERTLEVEGILVRGRTDYVDSEVDGQFCMRVNVCDQDGKNCLVQDEDIDGEHVNRVQAIVEFLNQ